ncbi:MAG TPA: BamA/TamA family outer membrane protein [Polyangiaceae bacterium]
MTLAQNARVSAVVARCLAVFLFTLFSAQRVLAQAPPTERSAPVDTWGTDEPETPPLPPPRHTTRVEPSPCPCGASDGEEDLVPMRYTLERIEIRGNTRTANSVVLRYLPFKPGQVIDTNDSAFQLARYRLLGTGFFVEVEFSLEKGTKRGLVVLVVEVVERNTIVVNDVSIGLSKDADPAKGTLKPLTAYAGIDVAETNLAGTGITLGGAMAIGEQELGLRARFLDPAFLGSPWMISGTFIYNNANDFFGNSNVRYADPERTYTYSEFAVVHYERLGGAIGVGHDLGVPTQVWAHYRLELIDASYPFAASHQRGEDIEPIDFDVIRGRSVLSTVKLSLQHDTRDHPFLPTRGWYLNSSVELALLPAALDYDYQKVELRVSRWWKLPWKQHVVELQFYGGAIAGNAPFFEQFHVGDFSDFRPDRVLGMNFDRRPPPNVLGTEIAEERYGEYAFSLTSEYRLPLYRGRRSIYGIDIFASGGIWGVTNRGSISDPPTGYTGFSRIPLDLTANIGFRMDTSVGGFTISFANALGFIPDGKSE